MTNVLDILYRLDAEAFKEVALENIVTDLFYFSFTTLTTVGYGDSSSAGSFSCLLTNFRRRVCVVYPTIFIALLVGQRKSVLVSISRINNSFANSSPS